MRITNPKNPRVQRTIRLRHSRERKKTGLFVIDGLREIERAEQAGVAFAEIYCRVDPEPPPPTRQWLRQVQPLMDCEWIEVDGGVFSKLRYGDRDDGIIAVAKIRRTSLDELSVSPRPFIVIAEKLEKPGNLGAVLRTADATGVDALLVADADVDLFNPNVIRASMGAAFTVPTVSVSAEEAISWCVERGITIFAARLEGTQTYECGDYCLPTAIALGNEARGLSSVWQSANIASVRLPMQGFVDCLNVSVTAGVLLYEVQRQRIAKNRELTGKGPH
jgi:TrmH family RNA methyltransferase